MSKIEFLNIDLDIESDEDIELLVSEIGKRATTMRNENEAGKYVASFEAADGEENEIIAEYKSIIDALSTEAKAMWDNCTKKDFDFGYESGDKPNDFHSRLSKDSIAAINDFGGEIVITIYPTSDANG